MKLIFADQAGVTPIPGRVHSYLMAAGWRFQDEAWNRILEGEHVSGPCTASEALDEQAEIDSASMRGLP